MCDTENEVIRKIDIRTGLVTTVWIDWLAISAGMLRDAIHNPRS